MEFGQWFKGRIYERRGDLSPDGSLFFYYPRPERDGWALVQEGDLRLSEGGYVAEKPVVWERGHPNLPAVLVMRCHGYQFHSYGDPWQFRYSVSATSSGQEEPLDGASWADWDQRGRLVFSSGAQLLSHDNTNLTRQPRLVADLSSQKPGSIVAPDWAKGW